jgi:dTDP-glucose 4,6-dehydratase
VATNVNGTLNVLEACRAAKVGRLVVTSTSEVYGTARYTPIDEAHPLQGQSPYSASKIAADKLAEAYFCSFDLPVVTLRPFNTYGPRQSARAVIPTVLTQALAGAAEIRLGNLEPKRDLTFVEDTARAFLLAAETPGIEGEVIHFGQGEAVRVGDLAQRCLEAAGSKARLVSEVERQRPAKSEVGLLLCNAAKARSLLKWSPTVGLDEGIARTLGYLREHLAEYRASGYVV